MSDEISQLELLDEGFWKNLAKTGMGVVGGIARGSGGILDYLAPQITTPVKSAIQGVRNVKQRTKEGYRKGYNFFSGRIEEFQKLMNDRGYFMDTTKKPKRSGANEVIVWGDIATIKNGRLSPSGNNTFPFIINTKTYSIRPVNRYSNTSQSSTTQSVR